MDRVVYAVADVDLARPLGQNEVVLAVVSRELGDFSHVAVLLTTLHVDHRLRVENQVLNAPGLLPYGDV